MSRLFHLQVSPRGERSTSIAVADAFVDAYRRAHPADEVRIVNLYQRDLPPFHGFASNAKYAILNGLKHTQDEQAASRRVAAITDEFKSYD